MSEKKVVGRNLAVALVLVCLLIGIGVGFAIGYGILNASYNQLKGDYDNLQTNYNSLQANYSNLLTNYSNLLTNYSNLQASPSVKGFVFDNTLKITVDIENQLGGVEAKENVTNIGTVSIPLVYVFIFSYRNGTLNNYNYATIQNLAPNETNSFDIPYLSGIELYSYSMSDYTFKTFALGNY